MKLLIDSGNTRIKWACVQQGEWLQQEALANEQINQLAQQFRKLPKPNEIWISNVAGEHIKQHITQACLDWKIDLQFIQAQARQCGVYNGYDNPQQLGCDRWAALIAAWQRIGKSCLVVNCGTATTIDALSDTGEFIGGVILPGLELMQRSLYQATTLKPHISGAYQAFPRNTNDALYTGAIMASCGAIEKQHKLLNNAPILLSGGAAAALHKQLDAPFISTDNLVLQGLWLISHQTG